MLTSGVAAAAESCLLHISIAELDWRAVDWIAALEQGALQLGLGKLYAQPLGQASQLFVTGYPLWLDLWAFPLRSPHGTEKMPQPQLAGVSASALAAGRLPETALAAMVVGSALHRNFAIAAAVWSATEIVTEAGTGMHEAAAVAAPVAVASVMVPQVALTDCGTARPEVEPAPVIVLVPATASEPSQTSKAWSQAPPGLQRSWAENASQMDAHC